MMRAILVGWLFVAMSLLGWFSVERVRHTSQESQHRYIWFYRSGHERQFGEYLEPITAEGLREIRWDRIPHPAAISLISTSSTGTILYPVSSGAMMTCSSWPMTTAVTTAAR